MVSYIEYTFQTDSNLSVEILLAELAELPFESFLEEDNFILKAYIPKSQWHKNLLQELAILDGNHHIHYNYIEIPQVNWNKEWESNFSPILVDNICHIRASFHNVDARAKHDIVINPKMSFGTGHHQTTYMMVQFLLNMNLTGRSVLDMGCGTSILAILSEKIGATKVEAIDIDPWCIENSNENIAINECKNIITQLGDVGILASKASSYDVIIANINRNILVQDIPSYIKSLKKGGYLLLSGFYEEDFIHIENAIQHLVHIENIKKDKWMASKYMKP